LQKQINEFDISVLVFPSLTENLKRSNRRAIYKINYGDISEIWLRVIEMWHREQVLPLDCGRRPVHIKQEQLDEDETSSTANNSRRSLPIPEPKYGQVSLEPVHGGGGGGGDSNNNTTTTSELYNCSQRSCSSSNSSSNNLNSLNGNGGMQILSTPSNGSNNNNSSRPPFSTGVNKKPKLSPMNWNHVPSVREKLNFWQFKTHTISRQL